MPPQDQNQQPYPQTPQPQPGMGPDPSPQPGMAQPVANQGYPAQSLQPQPQAQPLQPMQPLAQPQYAQYGQPGMQYTQAPTAQSESNTLGIVGIVLAFIFWPAGLVCSILAFKKSSKKTLAIIGIVLNVIGILISGLLILIVLTATTGIQDKARGSNDQVNLRTLQTQLELSYSTDGMYPSLSDLNSNSWRTVHMPRLDPTTLSPNSSQSQLVSGEPTDSAYAYTPMPAGCLGTLDSKCSSYTLSGKSTGGTPLNLVSQN